MKLNQYKDGSLVAGIAVAEDAKFIELGIGGQISFDEENPPQIKDGVITRASLSEGKLCKELPRDRHAVGILIISDSCRSIANQEFFPGKDDTARMGTTPIGVKQFHALNGSRRKFEVQHGETKVCIIYDNGQVFLE